MKTFVVRPYFGHDCNSWDGFNNGYFHQEIELEATDADSAAERCAVQFREENPHLEFHDYTEFDTVQWVVAYVFDGDELPKEVWEDKQRVLEKQGEFDSDRFGFLYQYIDFGADVREKETV